MKEEKVIDSKLLDSSIWLEYLFEGNLAPEIEDNKLKFISTLSLFEIKKKLLERKIPEREIQEKMKLIKNKCISLELTDTISEDASEIAYTHSLPAIDALIYMTAIKNECTLLTLDNDFRGLEKVSIFNK